MHTEDYDNVGKRLWQHITLNGKPTLISHNIVHFELLSTNFHNVTPPLVSQHLREWVFST